MGKWYGKIGFAETGETAPGVWQDRIVERTYFGDLIRAKRTAQTAEKMTDDIALSNQISIVADPYAVSHIGMIRYISFGGSNWHVSSAEYVRPRIILEIGKLWTGDEAEEDDGETED